MLDVVPEVLVLRCRVRSLYKTQHPLHKVVRIMDKSVAIIARTNRLLREPEGALVAANIPYYLVGKSGFWNSEEVRAAVNYLNACLFPANHIISGILRTSFHPTKFMPRQKLAQKFKEMKEADDKVSYWNLLTKEPRSLVEPRNLDAVQNFVSFIHSLSRYRDLDAASALKSVLGLLKVGDYYAEDEPDNSPLENLSDLLKLAAKYRSVKEFTDYCRRATAAGKKHSGVAVGTCHSVKGLEFDSVYFVGVSEGILPHAKSTDLEEEKSIYFVGCSRAAKKLVISYSGIPSVFLKKEKNETNQPRNQRL